MCGVLALSGTPIEAFAQESGQANVVELEGDQAHDETASAAIDANSVVEPQDVADSDSIDDTLLQDEVTDLMGDEAAVEDVGGDITDPVVDSDVLDADAITDDVLAVDEEHAEDESLPEETIEAVEEVSENTSAVVRQTKKTSSKDDVVQADAVNIADAQIEAIAPEPYTGKAIKPSPKVTYMGEVLVRDTDYTLSYQNNKKAGTATVIVSGMGKYTGTQTATFQIVAPTVRYLAYVEASGKQSWRKNGTVAGTIGESERLEGIRLKLGTNFPVTGGIRYRAHVQDVGWQSWQSDGALAGTSGESKRLEAIRIKLTGQMAQKYDVYYRVHAQYAGWMGWAKNGEVSGTSGMSWRLEGIQVLIRPKGTKTPTRVKSITSDTQLVRILNPGVKYRSFVKNRGWQKWVMNGVQSGIAGTSKRFEAAQIKLRSKKVPGSIQYRTYVQDSGWQAWAKNGAQSGAPGESKRVEAMRIRLRGEVSKYFDVWYRTYVHSVGWLSWARNGARAGSLRLKQRIDAYEVLLLPKGAAAPGDIARPMISTKRDLTIERYLAAAVSIAEDDVHGYSQENREGPDYDCSSLVVTSLKMAGVETGYASYTGNMLDLTNHGWSDAYFTSESELQRGDILLTPNYHTEFYMGNGYNVRAYPSSFLYGAITTGDQDGHEIEVVPYHDNDGRSWTYVLRLE